MKLEELSISDLSALMQKLSRQMSKLQDRTEENTEMWEQLAFKRSCCGSEFDRRLEQIEFPKPKKSNIR